MRMPRVETLARRTPLSRPARGGWASSRATLRAVRAMPRRPRRSGFTPRDVPVDATLRFPSARHVTGVDVVVRFLPQLRSWARTFESVALAKTPRRACAQAEPRRNECDAECRGAMPDIGLPGRARCFRTALRPRMRAVRPRTPHRLSTTRRASEASGPRASSRGIPPWVRWDRAPLGTDARSVSPAGVRTRVGTSLQIHRLDRRLACRRTSREGRRHICKPERVSSPSSCTGRAGSLPTRVRDDPPEAARRIAPSHRPSAGPIAP